MVRFTRSIKAVLSRPERPSPCKVAVRAALVPSRITGVTRTSLRRRFFFHLAVDQTRRHLPLACFPLLVTHREPLSKVGRQRIKVQVETIAGEERETAR